MFKDEVFNRKMGAWMGLFIGDALGTTNEFKERGTFPLINDMVGGGPFNLKAGQWTDDGSMALCLAAALIEDNGKLDQSTMMDRFVDWYQHGYYSSNGTCFDIGNQTKVALDKFIQTGQIEYPKNPAASGNGGIMRLAPVALICDDVFDCITYSAQQSQPTHASEDCIDTVCYFGKLLHAFIHDSLAATEYYDGSINTYKDINYDEVGSTGYCVDTLDFALYCFLKTRSFKDCVLMAANGGGDADTNAAVAGQIAGAYYGYSNIPQEWIKKLAKSDHLIFVGNQLISLAK